MSGYLTKLASSLLPEDKACALVMSFAIGRAKAGFSEEEGVLLQQKVAALLMMAKAVELAMKGLAIVDIVDGELEVRLATESELARANECRDVFAKVVLA